MDINTTISDEQAAALAQQLRVTRFSDGNDLIAQCAAEATLRAKQRGLIAAVAVEQDAAVIDATIAAFNDVAATKIKLPPIKTPGAGGVIVNP